MSVGRRLAKLGELLDGLARALRLEGLPLSADNAASLVFDERYSVEFQANADGSLVYLMSAIGGAPGADEEGARICRALLAAPLERSGMAGASFAVDRDAGEIVLLRALATESLTARELEREVEAFVNAVELWRSRAPDGVVDPDASAEEDAASPQESELALGGGAIRA